MNDPKDGDVLAEQLLPVAAGLVCAVEDRDQASIATLLHALNRGQLYGLAVVLAAHVDPDKPFAAKPAGPDHAIRVITTAAAARFGITTHRITARDKTRPVSDARAVVCYAGHLLGMSASSIGRYLDRDHTTVLHAIGRAGGDPKLRRIATHLVAPHRADDQAEDLAS